MAEDHEMKMANLTRQMQHNRSDLQSFISDLDSWESDIKKKEEKLMSGKKDKNDSLPPVRNTIHKKKLKKKKKEKVFNPDIQKKKLSGYDFQSWDRFDVNAALDEIDKEEKKETSSSEYETDEEWEMERKIHLAGIEKDKGNTFFKNGDYDRAVEAYSRGMEFDSTNAVLPANRAMALLKQQKYAVAELDCTTSISLDPLYVKAYLRRATARVNLSKLKEAIEDYNRVLDLEPTNRMAETELERLQKEKERDEKAAIPSTLIEGEKGRVKAIYKSPEERSKAPLRRIQIEEIGIETVKRNQQPLMEQSELTRKITEREGKNFETLIANSQVHNRSESNNQVTHDMPSPSSIGSSNKNVSVSSCKITELSTDKNKDNVQSLNNSEKLERQDQKSEKALIKEVKMNGNHIDGGVGKPDSSTTTSMTKEISSIPSIPQSSFQFQTDFKILKNKTEAFFKYFSAIKPCQYPTLFGQCLDADILKTIIKALLDHSQGSEVNIFEVLLGLTHVKRFSMTAMFLSQKEKQGAKELMERISISSLCSREELSLLRKKYDL